MEIIMEDYEEGTFTPFLTPDIGYYVQNNATGYYTKIGRTVNLSIYIDIASVSSPSGDLKITGLPTFGQAPALSYPGINIHVDKVSLSSGSVLQGLINYVDLPGTIVIDRFYAGNTYAAASCIKAGSKIRISASFPIAG